METLPLEIKVIIFDNFKTKYLRLVLSKVCQQWAEICKTIIDSRVRRIQSIPSLPNIKSRLSSKADNYSILYEAEDTRLNVKFSLTTSRSELRQNYDSRLEKTALKICDGYASTTYSYDECFKVIKSLNLAVVFNTDDLGLDFYNLDNSCSSSKPYECKPGRISGGLSSELPCFSLFRESILVPETARVLVIWNVQSCDHSKRVIHFTKEKTIFLPSWSEDALLTEDKVFVLFTTSVLGVYDRAESMLLISVNNASLLEYVIRTIRRLYLCGSVILLKILCVVGCHYASCEWYAVKLQNDEYSWQQLNLPQLFQDSILESNEICSHVNQVFSWSNCLILNCTLDYADYNTIYVLRISRSLQLDDLLCSKSFKSLINGVESLDLDFKGFICPPFLPYGDVSADPSIDNDDRMVAKFIIPKLFRRSSTYEIRNWNFVIAND